MTSSPPPWTTAQRGIIDELITISRDVVSRGLTLASGGNLSARDPDNPERFIITGMGTWFDKITSDEFSLVSLGGDHVAGVAPSSEWKVHHRAYLARPDTNSVMHVHPQYSVLVDALGENIRLLTLDHVSYVKSVGRVPFAPNGSDELASTIADQLGQHDCVVMAHHGCATVGDSIPMAYRRILNLEEAATNTYRCLVVGNTDAHFPINQLSAHHS
jgi:L-fuculose-phosphate aldolase